MISIIDAGSEEATMSDGQLRARVRAWEREQIWAPRWVDDELAATHQRRAQADTDATVWAARADAPDTDAENAAQLRAAPLPGPTSSSSTPRSLTWRPPATPTRSGSTTSR